MEMVKETIEMNLLGILMKDVDARKKAVNLAVVLYENFQKQFDDKIRVHCIKCMKKEGMILGDDNFWYCKDCLEGETDGA